MIDIVVKVPFICVFEFFCNYGPAFLEYVFLISCWYFISHIRNKLNSETPIIVFSAAGQEEMVLKAFNLGANDFMGKPFSPNELMIRVKRLLKI